MKDHITANNAIPDDAPADQIQPPAPEDARTPLNFEHTTKPTNEVQQHQRSPKQ